ncbi:MAG: GNAT family N-acetyltransferase [Bacteroidales bacterium]|nr:GNAT family N-acetyltransferase [Bacteroidales bacterium]
MENFKIRKIEKSEVKAAMAILEKWNMAPHKATKNIPNPERESLDLRHTFVAKIDDKIIGVCSYLVLSEEEAETASLAVDPIFKGKGVGYALQVARLKEMKTLGFSRVHTETDRQETVKWYVKKFGYKVVGTNPKKHDFSLKDVDHWTVLKLDLKNLIF